MLKVNHNQIPTFSEYWVLEEGIMDWIKEKVQGLFSKNLKRNDLRSKLLKLLKIIKDNFPAKFEEILHKLKNPAHTLRVLIASENPLDQLIVFILFVIFNIAMLPLDKIVLTRINDYIDLRLQKISEKQIQEFVSAVETQTPPSPEIEQKTEEVTQDLVKEVYWGKFANRKDFVNTIKKFESDTGNPLAAYFDRTQTSIGFGTRAKKGEKTLSPEEAQRRLIEELEENETFVRNVLAKIKPKWKLSENQMNGLIDISFNIGIGKLSQILHNSRNMKDVVDHIMPITHATRQDGTKVKSDNLIKRRLWEKSLLLSK